VAQFQGGRSTGLRASELASLTPAHFDLEAQPPTVAVLACDEKSRRGDTLPLSSDVVKLLRPSLGAHPVDARLWPGTWAKSHNGFKLMQHDLRSADVPYTTEDGTADFHALRHTYLSRLGRSGASPKVMMRLARHTTVELTLGRYTHANLYDLASAVEAMPSIPTSNGGEHESQSLRATGTDDLGVTRHGKDEPEPSFPRACAREANVLPECLPESDASEGIILQLGAVKDVSGDAKSDDCAEQKNALKTGSKPCSQGTSGSGWESNPPGPFSEATLGLKPRTVTRSAYTPRGC